MEISDPHLIGHHTVCYDQFQGEKACTQFEITEPQGVDMMVYSKFSKTLRDVLSDVNYENELTEILQKYPTSTYSAYLLWKLGHADYDPMREIGAERDFQIAEDYKKRNSEQMFRSYRKHLQGIIDPWEQLYRNFPEFICRPELLYALSRVYFQAGEQAKAAPLLKELEERHKSTEYANKAKDHVKVLKEYGLWRD